MGLCCESGIRKKGRESSRLVGKVGCGTSCLNAILRGVGSYTQKVNNKTMHVVYDKLQTACTDVLSITRDETHRRSMNHQNKQKCHGNGWKMPSISRRIPEKKSHNHLA